MSTYYKSAQHIDYTPVADTTAGTIVQVAGKAGLVANDIAAGELGAADIWAVVKVANPDSVVAADGVTLGYATATDKVTAAGAGDFDIGTSVGAAGDPAVVLLNGQDAVV